MNVCVCVCVCVCLSVCLSVCPSIGRKARESTYKLKVYSCVEFSEEDNGSGPESLGAPLRGLKGAQPPT